MILLSPPRITPPSWMWTSESLWGLLRPSAEAVIVPARLSGMLGARPDVAEYFQNALHDMRRDVHS